VSAEAAPEQAVTVLVVDDQPIMRVALSGCLDAEPDLTVVGQAADGEQAVALAGQLRPDVVVMDIRMPGTDGITATRRIVRAATHPPTRVLLLTTFDGDAYIVDGLRAGASGFLVKDSTPEELAQAVRVIARGQAQLSPSVTRRLLDLHASRLPPAPSGEPDPAIASLTPRELAVVRLAARGLPQHEIATALGLATSSVRTYIGHALAKLGLTDRVQLVVFAYEHQLVHPGWSDGTDGTNGTNGTGAAQPLR
jgi:DNA-binding NarL/FixJ family response regulator